MTQQLIEQARRSEPEREAAICLLRLSPTPLGETTARAAKPGAREEGMLAPSLDINRASLKRKRSVIEEKGEDADDGEDEEEDDAVLQVHD